MSRQPIDMSYLLAWALRRYSSQCSLLSANPFEKSRTRHFSPSSRFYRLLDLSTCPSRGIVCCISSTPSYKCKRRRIKRKERVIQLKKNPTPIQRYQIKYEMSIESGLKGRRGLVEMSPTELLGQKSNASNISARTLPKTLSSN